jgi:UDP-2-acetamido-3-amino-2,3-dideoxy-glucuronate N-acetyltransferase
MPSYNRIAPDVRLGRDVKLFGFVNLYGCSIGDETRIGTFVEVQKNATVGSRCKISSHTFICEGVTIEDEVFVGHGVVFINDIDPRATTGGTLQTEADWEVIPTRVCQGASIGSGAVILAGVTIGAGALVGAGAVVTRDVSPGAVVVGNPARLLRMRKGMDDKDDQTRELPHRSGDPRSAAGGAVPGLAVAVRESSR